ncbi:MAG: DUF971 domain-containing protein [Deltaproteobacteria bacterium]|nr:MAG: DUF971 domain-containing protein [Deltaproteobacteria bacterium]
MLDTARLPASRPSHKAGLEMHPDATHIERLKEVGRYALGVEWGDRHESILPYKNLRLACPCDACTAAAPDASLAPEAERPVDFQVLGDRSLFIRWADAHETLLLVEEVRNLCRCARCVGEPDFPISGR